jgi:DNA polymerase (family 10)
LEETPVDVLAHPTGRLLNQREPLDLDLDAVVAAAADASVAIEINAQPERLDLDWQAVREYRGTVEYVVSTDAHTTGELGFVHLGVSQARRGWCAASDVLNTRPLDELRSALDG